MHMTMKSLAVMKKALKFKSMTLYEHVHKSTRVELARALTLQIQSANVPASFKKTNISDTYNVNGKVENDCIKPTLSQTEV